MGFKHSSRGQLEFTRILYDVCLVHGYFLLVMPKNIIVGKKKETDTASFHEYFRYLIILNTIFLHVTCDESGLSRAEPSLLLAQTILSGLGRTIRSNQAASKTSFGPAQSASPLGFRPAIGLYAVQLGFNF